MAGNLSNYAENKLLDHLFGKASWPMPTNTYVGLFTAAPSDSGGGTEVSAPGYVRIIRSATDWNASSGGSISNATDIRFPASGSATANWGTPAWAGVFDASTAGNLLVWGLLSASVTIDTGDWFRVAAGGLILTLD